MCHFWPTKRNLGSGGFFLKGRRMEVTERFTFRGARSYTHFAKELRVSVNTVKSVWYRYWEEMQTLAKQVWWTAWKTRNFRRAISVPSIRFDAENTQDRHLPDVTNRTKFKQSNVRLHSIGFDWVRIVRLSSIRFDRVRFAGWHGDWETTVD